MNPNPRILLTGRPGCGKTTVIRRTVELIGQQRCAGFYTEEVRERGRRIGFDVVTVDGQRGPLARAGAAGPRVSRYGVDLGSFEALGVETLEAALDSRGCVLVLDEIGKMELFSERFVGLLDRIFEPAAERAILGAVMERHHPQVDRLREHPGVEVVRVMTENREDLPSHLSRIYGEFLETTK
jgi:nucleoside-triphosphatase